MSARLTGKTLGGLQGEPQRTVPSDVRTGDPSPRVRGPRPVTQYPVPHPDQGHRVHLTVPAFDGERLVQPARVTMFHNGVLVHLNEDLRGETGHRILPQYTKKISNVLISRFGS